MSFYRLLMCYLILGKLKRTTYGLLPHSRDFGSEKKFSEL